MTRTRYSIIGLGLGLVLLGAVTGCVGYVDGPRHGGMYAPSVHDGYVYYPGYQVYYSSSRHHYIYQDGRSWVTRSSPPRVSADVLFASPSVRLDFRDSPERHHATVAKQYPKHWAPPGHDKKGGHDDNRNKGKGGRN